MVMASTGGPNTLVATELTPAVADAIAMSAMIEEQVLSRPIILTPLSIDGAQRVVRRERGPPQRQIRLDRVREDGRLTDLRRVLEGLRTPERRELGRRAREGVARLRVRPVEVRRG